MAKTGVVVGVGGQIGTAVARRMLSEGWTVRGLDLRGSRLPADLSAVDVVVGDRNDAAALAQVLGHGADGVVDTIAYNSGHARQLVACANDIGALAVISSMAVYADDQGHSIGNGTPALPVPVPESQRLVDGNDATYGGGKVMLESILLDAGTLPVTALRPAAVCGPHSRHLREWWLIKRVLDGREKVPVHHRGRSRFHPSSTANIAALAVHSLGVGHSQVLNAADPDCPTVVEIAGYVAAAMNHRWQIVPLADSESAGPVGDTPWTAEPPIVLDTTKARDIGYEPATSYADALPGLVQAALAEVGDRDWSEVYPGLAAYPSPQFDYAAEDELLRELV